MYKNLGIIAWRNLRRNGRRSLATGTAVATGFAAFMLAGGYAYRVEKVLSTHTIYGLHVGHIGIYKKDALEKLAINPRGYSLTKEDQQAVALALQGVEHIEMKGTYLSAQGLAGNGCKTFPFMASGVDSSIEEKVMNHPNLTKWNGRLASSRIGDEIWKFPESIGAVAVSEGLARLLGKTKLHKDLGDAKPVLISDCAAPGVRDSYAADANIQLAAGTMDGSLGLVDGEVVMQYSTGLVETNNTSITTSVAHLQQLLKTDSVTNISVWLTDPKYVHSAVNEIKSRLEKVAPNLDVFPWTDERLSPYYTGTMQFILVMVGFLGCVLSAVVILSIFNSATMTVIERSQEVGMLRSIGYTQRWIRLLFVSEGIYLTMISVLFGAMIGLASMQFINALEIKINPPGVAGGLLLVFAPNIYVALAGAFSVGVLGVASTWLAVATVVRRNIADLVGGSMR